MADPRTQTLILTRVLGHRTDMPRQTRWKMFTERVQGKNDCWVCDHQVYSMLFWNELVGKADEYLFDATDRKYILKNLDHVLNEDNLERLQRGKELPFVTGQFTNW